MVDLSKAIFYKRYKIRPRVQLITNLQEMTHEEFTGVTVNDLDPSNQDFKVIGVFRRQ